MPERTGRAIVVGGEATVRRHPDLAVVSLVVSARDRKPATARGEANQRTDAILARLAELRVRKGDVQAPSLRLEPIHDYSRGKPKLVAYEASRPMTIRVRALDLLGTILDALVDDGATQVQGTSLELAEPEAAAHDALTAAVEVARARAEAVATAAGLTLGATLRIEEDPGSLALPLREAGALAMARMDVAPTTVVPGEIEITARIRATYALRRASAGRRSVRG